ncbi:DUF4236 domain-containing protein [Janibacter sp. DB-40]|uniref:DUF4236 domain-containing protein n=1 Tax=Janibacter sp. DB-40 TaxID=3028808 RepID=UPI0024059CB1|nr:DUF4236 domain-containing protein [Janibacter sp. DB-40]
MGFYFRVAPGVRVRLTGRGVRTSLGPRAARVHVGAGGPGVSTGAGPVSYYHGLGGSRPRRRGSTGQRSRSLAAATKAEQAEQIARAIDAVLELHRPHFPPAERPEAERWDVLPLGELIRRREKAAAAEHWLFAVRKRRAARKRARATAIAEHAALVRSADVQQEQDQLVLDAWWHRLLDNDHDAVLAALARALEDNDAESAPVGVEADVASVVVRVPDAEALPERIPGTTAAGNLSLRKATRSQWNALYSHMVAGYVVVTAKEVLATAPSIREAGVVAVRRTPADAYGDREPEALMAARFTRETLEGVRWEEADAMQVLTDASTEYVLEQKGIAREIQALDTDDHPDIAAAVRVIDLDDDDDE